MIELRSSKSLGSRDTPTIAAAIGAVAVVFLAIRVLAIGRLAIRRVSVESAEFESLVIQDLTDAERIASAVGEGWVAVQLILSALAD